MQPINLNLRALRRVVARYILVSAADAVSVAATAAVLPKIYFRHDLPHWYVYPFVVALLLGLLNALVRPILIVLLLPITVLTLGLATLALNAALFYIAHFLIESFVVESFAAAVAGVLVLTIVNTFLGNVLRLSDDYSFYAAVMDRLSTMTRGRVVESSDRGLVVVQIDGLSHASLKRAMRKGKMPFLQDLVKRKRFALRAWFSGLPSQTSSVQAGLFYGTAYDIPGFRWYDKKAGRLVSSSNSADMSAVDERFASRPDPLLRDGTCVNTLIHGGAKKRVLTLSMLGDRDFKTHRAELEDFAIFSMHPYLYTRTILAVLTDFTVDRAQALVDAFRSGKKRIGRSVKFSFLRAIGNAALRESTTYFVIEDIVRGVPVIYANYVGYDMVAHHAGADSGDAIGTLTRIDRKIRKISRAISRKAPRTYDLVVLSDHGQTDSVPFSRLYGESLSEFVGKTLQRPVTEEPESPTGQSYFNTLLREMRLADETYKRRSLARNRRTLERLGERISEEETGTKGDGAYVVCVSGPLAHIYLTQFQARLSAEFLFQQHSGLLEALTGHPGIGFTVVVMENGNPLVIGKAGLRRLSTGEIEGDDPLRSYLKGRNDEHALRSLADMARFPSSGDIIVNGAMIKAGLIVAFEKQASTHGGLGGRQNEPFIIYPGRLRKRQNNPRTSEELHAFLTRTLSGGVNRVS